MMTHIKGFSITSLDELVLSSVQFDELMSDAFDIVNPIGAVYTSTVSLLRFSFWLAKQKATLSKKDFNELLSKLKWNGEEKPFLKVDKAFSGFFPEDLAQVEPRTIFKLAENFKKYQSVFTQLVTLPLITQDIVRNLIQNCRKPRAKREKKEPTIWMTAPDNGRFFQPPPMYDDATGVMLEQIMKSEGRSAQSVIAEGIALVKQKLDALKAQEECPLPVNNDSEVVNLVTSEEVIDTSNSTTSFVPIDETLDSDLWRDDIEDYDLLTLADLELQNEMTPVERLIETFQSAQSWEEISEMLHNYEQYKDEAWEALTPLERRQVIEIMPKAIRRLRDAKRFGKIADFRELREGVYEVLLNGCMFWEIVYKSWLDNFLAYVG
ncbi:hypothetical protein DSM106972_054630 [Dulcicalothrix desertica PCC 7102]|uniref:Uncharacterized protein n=1 Tax=Dulcicalothrix desertica PCC 7102 TaxID=232991 RepID=A0A3S1B1Q8_9CYAN|nr:hypothetical protein [Dulcicalothrix desertica]RUT03155.1 hypothetical protein DSM106972_054630 [Dulcicalothrix desertica PCC 7102]TWH53527.1 hypothetical protein CAL7102_01488 [Dulcicalothrix desertica PCC 7102]